MRVFLVLVSTSLFVSFTAHARYDVQNISDINFLADDLCEQGHGDAYVRTELHRTLEASYQINNLKFLTSIIKGLNCNTSTQKVALSIDNFRGTWCQKVENPEGRRRLLSISPTFNGAQILFNGIAEVENSVSGSWDYESYHNELSFYYDGGDRVDFVVLYLDAEKLTIVSKDSTKTTLEFSSCGNI